ncbi:(2Fe-2S)-binding protein [Micromonospora aurantiaca (nom. illeg.)]
MALIQYHPDQLGCCLIARLRPREWCTTCP